MSASRWIDAYRQADGSINRRALLEFLPYGEAFLFVDRVDSLDADTIEASYIVPKDSPLLGAHFVDAPIMPGVLTGEGLAQAGTVLLRQHLPDSDKKHILATKISNARFTGVARPGDEIRYRVQLRKFGSQMAQLDGEASVAAHQIASVSMVLAIRERHELSA